MVGAGARKSYLNLAVHQAGEEEVAGLGELGNLHRQNLRLPEYSRDIIRKTRNDGFVRNYSLLA